MAVDLGVDEGGDGDTLLVSVQIGITEQARRMRRSWKKRLAESNNVEYFHSKDLWNFTNGPFFKAGLNRQERTSLLNDLADCIHEHLATAFTVKVSQKVYNDNTTQVLRSQHGSAYRCCIIQLVSCAYMSLKKMRIRPEVNILIEAGHRNSAGAVLYLNKWRESPPLRGMEDLKFLSVGLGSKKDHPILQAADMLAYCKQQHLIRRDRTIYDALHRKGSRYQPQTLTLGAEHFKEL